MMINKDSDMNETINGWTILPPSPNTHLITVKTHDGYRVYPSLEMARFATHNEPRPRPGVEPDYYN